MKPLPNTHLIQILPNVLICAGEDESEFIDAATRSLGRLQPLHAYRCYRFWSAGDILLAWTGIGTGCIEPLLMELALAGKPRRIALMGTAGLPENSGLALGECRAITHAFARNCAINAVGVSPDVPLQPQSGRSVHAACTIASTDFYYPVADFEWPLNVDLVDMEVAQFYHICAATSRLTGHPREFLAFKGAANRLGVGEEQARWTGTVLTESARLAASWLVSE